LGTDPSLCFGGVQITYKIQVQMLEIYNESLRDLLVENASAGNNKLEILNTQVQSFDIQVDTSRVSCDQFLVVQVLTHCMFGFVICRLVGVMFHRQQRWALLLDSAGLQPAAGQQQHCHWLHGATSNRKLTCLWLCPTCAVAC
jgi:hypothetical protein